MDLIELPVQNSGVAELMRLQRALNALGPRSIKLFRKPHVLYARG